MAGNASFGRLSTEAGVKAFVKGHGLEPGAHSGLESGPKRERRRRRGRDEDLARGSAGGTWQRLIRSNKHHPRRHIDANGQYLSN